MRHDINEDWIEFFFKDSAQPAKPFEHYHEYMLRKFKEERENEAR